MKYYPHKFKARITEIKKVTRYYTIIIADHYGIKYELAVPNHIKKDIGSPIWIKRCITDNMELFDYYYEVVR